MSELREPKTESELKEAIVEMMVNVHNAELLMLDAREKMREYACGPIVPLLQLESRHSHARGLAQATSAELYKLVEKLVALRESKKKGGEAA